MRRARCLHRCLHGRRKASHASTRRGMKAWSQAGQDDLYVVLGVNPWADREDIKQRYYYLAKKYHPDTNEDDPTAHEKFADATAAYKVLIDDDKRQKYDQFGHAGLADFAGLCL